MSLGDSFALDLEDSGLLLPNVSGVAWESTGAPHRYNIWPPGIAIAAIYGVIIVVGLVGNVSLMRTCLTVKSMRTVPNLFLSSLALGDVLLLLTCAPVDASRYLVDEWLFGRVGCKLIPFIQLTSVGVSVFTLTALSADRYYSHIVFFSSPLLLLAQIVFISFQFLKKKKKNFYARLQHSTL